MIHRRLDAIRAGCGPVAVVLPASEVADLPRLTAAQLADAARGAAPAVLRRQLLAALVGRVLGIAPGEVRLLINAGGRRRLAGDARFVSVAWRPGWVAAAVADVPVGIDVELIAEAEAGRAIALAGFGDDPQTLAAWHGLAGVWAAKEAALKANGRDLTTSPERWSFAHPLLTGDRMTPVRIAMCELPDAIAVLASVVE